MQKLLRHPLFMLIVGVVAVIFVLSLRTTEQATQKKAAAVDQNQARVTELQLEKDRLQNQLNDAQQPFLQEEILRNELLEQQEGEVVIQLPSVAPNILPSPSPTPTTAPLEAWKELIFWKVDVDMQLSVERL